MSGRFNKKYFDDPLYDRLFEFSREKLSIYEKMLTPKDNLWDQVMYCFDGRSKKMKILNSVRLNKQFEEDNKEELKDLRKEL